MRDDERVAGWLEALERRHLADLTTSEVARALRALSSCYVERRAKLARGGALDSAGKRAAFALFYAPLHFLVVREIVRAIDSASSAGSIARILDLGCGTGAAGAAWALECGRCAVDGVDRHAWAVAEANWTYRTLGLAGRARQADVDRLAVRGGNGQAILAAYTVNELPDATRDAPASAPDRRTRTRLPHPDRRTDRAPDGRVVDGVGQRLHGCRRDRPGMAVRHPSSQSARGNSAVRQGWIRGS